MKSRIASTLILVIFFFLIVFFATQDDVQEPPKEDEKQSSVVLWLNAFCSKDFDTCDTLVNYGSSLYALTTKEDAYYNKVLYSLVDCISFMEVQKVTTSDDGSLIYDVYVEYTPYYALGDLVLPDLTDLKNSYINDEISNLEFQQELEKVYFEIFCNSCFQVENETTRSQVLVLTEKEVNGVTRVYNTVSFVDSLLSESNIKRNVSIYEKDIKEKIAMLIKAN